MYSFWYICSVAAESVEIKRSDLERYFQIYFHLELFASVTQSLERYSSGP